MEHLPSRHLPLTRHARARRPRALRCAFRGQHVRRHGARGLEGDGCGARHGARHSRREALRREGGDGGEPRDEDQRGEEGGGGRGGREVAHGGEDQRDLLQTVQDAGEC